MSQISSEERTLLNALKSVKFENTNQVVLDNEYCKALKLLGLIKLKEQGEPDITPLGEKIICFLNENSEHWGS